MSPRSDQILREAARLFAAKGYAATTVREIGDAVGMQSGSLYKYFGGKEDIVAQVLFAYLDEHIAECTAIVEANDRSNDRLAAVVDATFRTMIRHRHACEIAQSDERLLLELPSTAALRERSEQVRVLWFTVIEEAVADGRFRKDLDIHAVYWFIRGAMWFTIHWYDPDGPIGVDEMIRQLTEFITTGYRPENGEPA